MHLLRTELRSLDETAPAVDLGQSRADIVVLSFADSDLAVLAKAWESLQSENVSARGLSLRLASLADLKHPYSVDLYVEKVIAHARFVLVRLLGGLDYWKYGVEEVARAVQRTGAPLAIIPGEPREDPRLTEASTIVGADWARLGQWMLAGGVDNSEQALRFALASIGVPCAFAEPVDSAHFGLYERARRKRQDAPRALVVFYRSSWLAGDVEPYEQLADSLADQNFDVRAAFVTSLKDPGAVPELQAFLKRERPDVILNATAFSARLEDGSTAFDVCDAPVFQVAASIGRLESWQASARGFSPADLAMNVVLPEFDGRIFGAAIAFKAERTRIENLEYSPLRSEPHRGAIDHVAALAAGWGKLARTAPAEKRLAFILSDYPGKGGRAGYAVGLDTFASVSEIVKRLAREGYRLGVAPDPAKLAAELTGPTSAAIDLAAYRARLDALPEDFVASVRACWGEPESDTACENGGFRFAYVRLGASVVALQPDRGHGASRKEDFHDPSLPPRHAYVAFYIWLREIERVHAIVHVGAHGTLEWLPGKAVALSPACAPRVVLGPVPLIYPFIVNNPGEAAQAKRRAGAVTLGHLTPPLIVAGAHGGVAEIEGLMDEYAEAQALDPRRARRLAELIRARAEETGLAEEAGLGASLDPEEALARLDAWLCDLKEMRIGDGLHVFGRVLAPERRAAMLEAMTPADESANADKLADPPPPSWGRAGVRGSRGESPVADQPSGDVPLPSPPPQGGREPSPQGQREALLDACAPSEMDALVRALAGKRVAPGPGGAPTRGRLDTLPTGRNLYSVDPRAIPTRTAWELGTRAAQEFLARYAQDHGDWPRRVVFDLWGSSTMRTGGEDLAHAMALIGVRPIWDHASNRVSGFEILTPATLGRPRVDVTLRISGLFRDVFPAQIAMFHAAAEAVSERDETDEDNPLAQAAREGQAVARVFGAAPGAYGTGVGRMALEGDWTSAAELGAAYLAATSHAYEGEASRKTAEFAERVAQAQAYVHVQDAPGQDVLDSDAFAEHEGGFAAAAASAGARPALYHLDATDPQAPKVRTVAQEIARALRARATNPRWLEGQMRHGFRGAAEIAESVDNLFVFAATTDAVPDRMFDLMFDAVCADSQVRDFLREANPQAAAAIAKRFADAIDRGLWTTRRNSAPALLDALRGAP